MAFVRGYRGGLVVAGFGYDSGSGGGYGSSLRRDPSVSTKAEAPSPRHAETCGTMLTRFRPEGYLNLVNGDKECFRDGVVMAI
jgi:hypothetical protein